MTRHDQTFPALPRCRPTSLHLRVGCLRAGQPVHSADAASRDFSTRTA